MNTIMPIAINTFLVGAWAPEISSTPKTPRTPAQFIPILSIPTLEGAAIICNFLNGGGDYGAREIIKAAAPAPNARAPEGAKKDENGVQAEVASGIQLLPEDASVGEYDGRKDDNDPRLDARWKDNAGIDANGSPVE